MVTVVRNPKTDNHLQDFRGGWNDLDQITRTRLQEQSCCAMGVKVEIDRLPPRMRPNNDLSHTRPTGNNEKRRYGGVNAVTNAIVKHIHEFGDSASGAIVGVFAVPDLCLLKSIGVSIRTLPAGVTMTVAMRSTMNGDLVANGGQKYEVETSGDTCDPTRDFVQTALTPADVYTFTANNAGVFTKETVLMFDTGVGGHFMPNCDEITIIFSGTPANIAAVTAQDIDFTIGVNYDTVIRAEI